MRGVWQGDELNREGFIKIWLFFSFFLLFIFSLLLDLFCFCFCLFVCLFVCLAQGALAHSFAGGGQPWTFRDSFRFVSKNPEKLTNRIISFGPVLAS